MTSTERGPGPASCRRHATWLVLACVIAYASAVPGGFVWLDHTEIVDGGYRLTGAGDWSRLWTSSLDRYLDRAHGDRASAGGYWRPLHALSVSLDWWAWGACATCMHAENVAWHALVVLALYALGCAVLVDVADGRRAALWASAAFAVHPIGVQSVTWVSGRKDALCALFAVLALLAFQRLLAGAPRPRLAGTLMLASFALALLAKELALVVPGVAAVTLWFGWPRVAAAGTARRAALALAALWLAAGAYLAFRAAVLGGIGLNAVPLAATPLERLATSASVLLTYLGRAALPLPPRLSDGWPLLDGASTTGLAVLATLAIVAALTAALLWRRRPAGWALACAACWLAPASGVVALRHVYAERYLYPAAWGVTLAVALLALAVARRQRLANRLVPAVAGAWLLVAAIVTGTTNVQWWDDRRLFEQAVADHPRYREGRLVLGDLALRDGRAEDAVVHLQAVVAGAADRRRTGYWAPYLTYNKLGLAWLALGQLGEARRAFETATTHAPGDGTAHYHLGLVADRAGDTAAAVRHYRDAVARSPGDRLARGNLASALLRAGRHAEAAALLQPLVAAHPGERLYRVNLAAALLADGRFEAARAQLRWLVETQPDDALSRAKLAWSEWRSGERQAARRNIAAARRALPHHPAVRFVVQLIDGERDR